MPDQARTTRSTPAEPSIGQIVLGDLKQADLPRTLRQDFKDLYAFYLSDERREKLAAMGTVKGIFWFWGWLAMGLLTRLTPARRLMLLLSVVLLATGSWEIMLFNVSVVLRTGILGILLVFLVLMLELKDKLLARDEIEVARQVQLAL
ncbi:MAG TPA: hypothetical protein VFP98_09425, partial [Candidatus Polarisedimenticolia bacterium]|nr:hypothetical protein [Candidatus Polarisedimenticolia bacterium]